MLDEEVLELSETHRLRAATLDRAQLDMRLAQGTGEVVDLLDQPRASRPVGFAAL